MNVIFWVIQLALLLPVLFMALTAGQEGSSRRGRVSVAFSGLNQFTAEQQTRLLRLRAFVQDARVRGGPLADDLKAAPRVPARGVPVESGRTRGLRTLVAVAVLFVAVGGTGVLSTNSAMDALQKNAFTWTEPLSPGQRFLPGVFANPARYISAINGAVSGVQPTGWNDPFYAIAVMDQKVAMDRWEALAGVGIGLLLFASAMRSVDTDGETRAISFDIAPLMMVGAVLFAALSFCELP